MAVSEQQFEADLSDTLSESTRDDTYSMGRQHVLLYKIRILTHSIFLEGTAMLI